MKFLKISAIAVTLVAVPLAAQTGDNWEGLVKVKSQRADAAYLLPGVDFRTYTKVMFDPTEVAFRQNWQRDYNRSTMGGRRIDDREVAEITTAARSGFEEIFTEAYRRSGLAGGVAGRTRRAAASNRDDQFHIVAPDQMTAGRSRTYSPRRARRRSSSRRATVLPRPCSGGQSMCGPSATLAASGTRGQQSCRLRGRVPSMGQGQRARPGRAEGAVAVRPERVPAKVTVRSASRKRSN